MKKLGVIAPANNPVSDAIAQYFQNKNVKLELLTDVGSSNDYDLIACVHGLVDVPNAINIHPSLLPAFNSETPITDAFMAGVKVTGVTVHYADGKIITQYPVLIGNLTHFDELENKITEIEQKIYPIVIDKILNDEVFDFDDLFGGGCNGGCNGCGKCH